MKKENLKSVKPEYPTWNEFKTKTFLNIATAVGIGVSAAAISLESNAEEKKVVEKKTDEATELSKGKDQIILLVANLGHDDFKERDKATALLIAKGKKYEEEKNSVMTALLKSELEKCKTSKDPEVKQRAKNILLAITPKPPEKIDRVIMGKIRAPR